MALLEIFFIKSKDEVPRYSMNKVFRTFKESYFNIR